MTNMDEGGAGLGHPDPDIPSGAEDVLPARPPGRRAKPPAERPASPLVRIVLPAALAVIAAVMLFLAWNQLQSSESDEVAGPAPGTSKSAPVTGGSGSPSTSPSSASPTESATESAAESESPSAEPTESASDSVSESESPSAEPTQSASESPAAVVIDRSVPVTVLNGTRRTGLAAKVAADLRAKGWTVVSIGNWRAGGVTTTTVFVNGRADAAATIRRDLPAADATKTPIGAMRSNRITVVVMDDYPKS